MILAVIIALFVLFNITFLLALYKKDFSIIDITWGISFLVIYLTCLQNFQGDVSLRQLIVGVLVALWSFRLSGYILFRAIKKGKEDFRYAAWREEWGAKANQTAYIRVYMLQLVLSVLIASPLILLFNFASVNEFGTALDIIGILLWIIGFLFEAIGDYQKNKFKKNKENKEKFCNIGLWQYSRHPNYFGEALLWWGIFLIIINSVPIYYAVWGPLLLNFLLVKVSGVAMLEESYKERDGFAAYKLTTNRFIPWFKKGKI